MCNLCPKYCTLYIFKIAAIDIGMSCVWVFCEATWLSESERGCVSINLKLVGLEIPRLELGIILHFEHIKLGKTIDSDKRTKNIQHNGVILNFISNMATLRGCKSQGWSRI